MCDDLFDGVLELESQMYNQGVEEGNIEGDERQKLGSIEEGKKYGLQIGNHLGYYKEIINMMIKFKIKGENSRAVKLGIKLLKVIENVDISECYEEDFEKKMNKIREDFKKFLSLLKVKSKSDNPQDQMEF